MPNETGEIDLLIATDCISEGQNLQDCDYLINYDIHWNPVRIIQRFGRIDRIGSRNAQIQLVNFWPNMALDEYINLKERVENRMVIADITATGDDNVLTQEVERHRVPQGATAPAPGRSHRAGRPQDRRLHHRSRPERLPHGPAQLRQGERRPRQRSQRACTPSFPPTPDVGLQPASSSRCGTSTPTAINRGNRLHPYYLVYLDDDGKVIADHTEVKRLLDLIRTGCRPTIEPVPERLGALQRRHQGGRRDGPVLRPAHHGDPLDDRGHGRNATSTAFSRMARRRR